MEINYSALINNVIIQITIIIVAAVFLHHISGRIITFLTRRALRNNKFDTGLDRKKREDTLINIVHTGVGLAIWLLAVALILKVLNFNLASIATGAGFLGIVVGLGAQTTIRDYLAGFFILTENQYRVGDIVTLSGGTTGLGTTGVVEEISLRITKLRALDGTLSIVRNGEASVMTNRTFRYSSVLIDVGVSYDSDIDKVERVMNKVGQDMLQDEALAKEIKEPIAFLRVDKFDASAVVVRVVGTVNPAKQWDIEGEYRRRLLKTFKEEGIEIPYPQIVVHQKNKHS